MGAVTLELLRDKGWLECQYWDKKRSTHDIAVLLDCGTTTIKRWMHRHGIPMRSDYEARSNYWGRPEIREQLSKQAQKAWEDGYHDHATYAHLKTPAFRARMGRLLKERIAQGKLDHVFRDPERNRNISEKAKERHRAGLYDGVCQSPTSIEIEVAEALDDLGVSHISQFHPEDCTFRFDELAKPNVLIEVNGCYWHVCPKCFPDQTKKRRKEAKREQRKQEWTEAHGYELLILWEHDIREVGATVLLEQWFDDAG